MLSSRIPYPLTAGYRLRICAIAKIISKYHRIDLLTIHEDLDNEASSELKKIFNSVTIIPKKKFQCIARMPRSLLTRKPMQVESWLFSDVRRRIVKESEKYDLIYCNHIRMAEYLNTLAQPILIDFHDAISLHYRRGLTLARGLWKWIYKIEYARVKNYEIQTLEKWNNFWITSPVDASYLESQIDNKKNIIVIPQGVREEILSRQKKDNNIEQDDIVFVGKMDYYPNEDAVNYFAKKVFPSIKKVLPHVKFVIVGAYPTKKVERLINIDGVKVMGYVKNVDSYIEQAKIVVAPLRFGAGIQNKVLEAMALQKAVVASPIAVDGIDGQHGKHYVVARTPDQMAKKIVELFDQPLKRQGLGEQARQLIADRYTWKTHEPLIISSINAALNSYKKYDNQSKDACKN